MKIDTSKAQVPIWLVWTLSNSGNNVLCAICLENSIAITYRKALLEDDNRIIKCWIEPREANHLYASMFEILSDDSIRELARQLNQPRTKYDA